MAVYQGFRGQGRSGIRVTQGLFASEGVGVYIALDKGLGREFAAGSGRYLQELEFRLDKPLVISDEPLYILYEAPEVEEPVENSDSAWLKANKLAYQMAMEAGNNNWSKASELVGGYLTDVLQDMGYDGVLVDQGKDNRWAVVFNPANVKILQEKRNACMNRDARLAQILVRFRN